MVSSERTASQASVVDHLADAVADGLGGVGLAAAGAGDRGGEEIFQLEHAPAGRHVLVGGDPRDGRFVHADGVGHGLEVQGPQVLDAEREEGVLLADDLDRHLEDRPGALLEAAREPVGGLDRLGEEGLVLVGPGGLRDACDNRSG